MMGTGAEISSLYIVIGIAVVFIVVLLKNYFYCFIKLSIILLCMKFIQQGLQFSWFLKRAITSGKISS